jgi:hypothetical protein
MGCGLDPAKESRDELWSVLVTLRKEARPSIDIDESMKQGNKPENLGFPPTK